MPKTRAPRVRFRPARALAVIASGALAFSAIVLGTAAPSAAAVEHIQFEAPNNSRVVLGALATRSQRKPVTISGIGPYTVRGTDSLTGDPYEFVTDVNYNASNLGWQRESDERALSAGATWNSTTNATVLGRSGVMQLSSNMNCAGNNDIGGITTYCSTFGPDVYSKPFTATVGQSVSFDWAAQAGSDDYEVYAYLVKVTGTGYGTPADHTLIAYGRGGTQGWTTTSKEIPANGTYRFRFVNGSYDRTGGYALGSTMYIDSIVKLGTANPITFGNLSDRVIADGGFQVSATAPGGPVTFTSSTTSICTVSGTTVSLTGNVGVCTITANQAGSGDYVPAETVARSFRVLAARTAPVNAGLPYVTGTVAEGETITADEGTWVDGGSPITGTSYQWTTTASGTTTSIPGATSASCYLVESPGSQLRVTVTKTNAIGSTTAASTTLNGYTCGAPAAPAWTDQALGDIVVGNSVSQALTASGMTKPTYTVVDGALPDGLTLNATTGLVSGTPTTAGPYEFTLRATNPSGTDDLVVTGTVNAAPGTITGTPDQFVVGEESGGTLAATGTPAPTFTVSSGTLPDGVTLDPVSGEFGGTPTAAGAYAFTVTAGNGVGTATTREFTGTVEQAPGWGSEHTWAPEVGVALDVTFTAEGTPAPAYSIGTGDLPAGLALDGTTGRITGTPTEAGAYSFTIVATNGHGTSSLPLSGTVVDAPGAITGGSGLEWVVGNPATGSLSATGTPAPVYTVTEGSLPPGVTLDPATGEFSGTPTAPGPYAFTVTADNGVGTPTTKEFSGVVDQAPVWGTQDGLALVVGSEVSESYTATGTPAPTYSVTAGKLPKGLTLDETTGAISGTPTEPGPYAFTLTADNGVGDPAVLEFTGIVNASPTWVDTKIARLRVGEAFADSVAAEGTPTATYAVTAGKLPRGLVLDKVTGAITGTPTQAGDYAFTVSADNGVGDPITHEFTGTVLRAVAVDDDEENGSQTEDDESTSDDATTTDDGATTTTDGPDVEALPDTGSGNGLLTLLAGPLLLAAGFALVLVRRARRRLS